MERARLGSIAAEERARQLDLLFSQCDPFGLSGAKLIYPVQQAKRSDGNDQHSTVNLRPAADSSSEQHAGPRTDQQSTIQTESNTQLPPTVPPETSALQYASNHFETSTQQHVPGLEADHLAQQQAAHHIGVHYNQGMQGLNVKSFETNILHQVQGLQASHFVTNQAHQVVMNDPQQVKRGPQASSLVTNSPQELQGSGIHHIEGNAQQQVVHSQPKQLELNTEQHVGSQIHRFEKYDQQRGYTQACDFTNAPLPTNVQNHTLRSTPSSMYSVSSCSETFSQLGKVELSDKYSHEGNGSKTTRSPKNVLLFEMKNHVPSTCGEKFWGDTFSALSNGDSLLKRDMLMQSLINCWQFALGEGASDWWNGPALDQKSFALLARATISLLSNRKIDMPAERYFSSNALNNHESSQLAQPSYSLSTCEPNDNAIAANVGDLTLNSIPVATIGTEGSEAHDFALASSGIAPRHPSCVISDIQFPPSSQEKYPQSTRPHDDKLLETGIFYASSKDQEAESQNWPAENKNADSFSTNGTQNVPPLSTQASMQACCSFTKNVTLNPILECSSGSNASCGHQMSSSQPSPHSIAPAEEFATGFAASDCFIANNFEVAGDQQQSSPRVYTNDNFANFDNEWGYRVGEASDLADMQIGNYTEQQPFGDGFETFESFGNKFGQALDSSSSNVQQVKNAEHQLDFDVFENGIGETLDSGDKTSPKAEHQVQSSPCYDKRSHHHQGVKSEFEQFTYVAGDSNVQYPRMSMNEYEQYHELFASIAGGAPINIDQATSILAKAKLPPQEIEQIWYICADQVDMEGMVLADEFAIILHLAFLRCNGAQLPSAFPAYVLPADSSASSLRSSRGTERKSTTELSNGSHVIDPRSDGVHLDGFIRKGLLVVNGKNYFCVLRQDCLNLFNSETDFVKGKKSPKRTYHLYDDIGQVVSYDTSSFQLILKPKQNSKKVTKIKPPEKVTISHSDDGCLSPWAQDIGTIWRSLRTT